MNRFLFEFGYFIGLAKLAWHTNTPAALLETALESEWMKPGDRVLEVGCGLGTNSEWLATYEFDVTAIDLSGVAARRARAHLQRRGLRAKIYQADFLQGLREEPFDVVFDRATLHAFPRGEKRKQFAQRLAEQVKPGGLILLTQVRSIPSLKGRKMPPFGVDLEDLQELFGSKFDIRSVGEEQQHHRGLGMLPFGQWSLRHVGVS